MADTPISSLPAATTVDGTEVAPVVQGGATKKLALSVPLNRANHTGTQSASTVTGLSTVATSGAYSDLTGKPTIPTTTGTNTGDQTLSVAGTALTISGANGNTVTLPTGGGTAPNATTSAPGLVQLAGDLAGTAAAPTVGKLAGAIVAPAPSGDVTGATDTAALQAVIDGIASTSLSGGAVQLRPGVYYGRIKMRPLVRIWGSGIGATRLMAPDGATGAVVDTADSTQWNGGVEVAYMTIDGNNLGRDGTGTTKSTTVGLNWQSTGDPYVLPSGSASGPYANHWDHDPNPFFHHLNIVNCGNDGMRIGGQSSVGAGDPSGCQASIHHCLLFSNWGNGIAVTGPDAMIDHVQIGLSKGHGVQLSGQASAYLSNVKSWYSGSWGDGVNFYQYLVGHGFYINGMAGQIVLVGCQSQDNGGFGVAVNNCTSIYVGTHQSGGDNLGVFQLSGGSTGCRLDGVRQTSDLANNGPLLNIDGAATTTNTVSVWAAGSNLPATPVTYTNSGASTGNTVTIGANAPNLSVAAVVTAAGTLKVNQHNPVNATSAAVTMTLPTGQTQGTTIVVEKTDASANTITLSGNIRGMAASTIVLYWQNEALYLIADGAGSWWPVAGHKTKAALDAAYAQRANNLSDLVSAATARTNLGLGTAATQPSTAFDAAGAAAAVLPSQTGQSGNYLTTNGTAVSWAAVAGGGGGVAQSYVDAADSLRPSFPTPQIGDWIHGAANNISNTGYPNGEADLGPIYLPAGTYDMVAFQVNTAGSTGALVKAVAYSNVNGRPSALLFDTATVDGTTTGVKQITLASPLVIGAGGAIVWGGTVTQGAPASNPSIWSVSSFSAYPAVWSSPQFTASWPRSFVITGITGSAPSTTSTTTTGTAHPRLAFHRSA